MLIVDEFYFGKLVFERKVELFSTEVLFYSTAFRHLFSSCLCEFLMGLSCIHLLAPGGTCYLTGLWLWKECIPCRLWFVRNDVFVFNIIYR